MNATVAAAFSIEGENKNMASKAKGGGLVLSVAARKVLSERAAAADLTPEKYLEVVLTTESVMEVLGSLVYRAIATRAQMRAAAEKAQPAKKADQPGTDRPQQPAGKVDPPRRSAA